MTHPSIPDEKVRHRARHFRHLKRDQLYPAFAGFADSALNDPHLSDAERVADLRLSLAALDMALADADRPARPPYGSSAREWVDRIAPIADEQAD